MKMQDETAIAIIKALREAPSEGLITTEFREAVEANGGYVGWIPAATKMLRDCGVPIIVQKRRQNTRWSIENGDEAWNLWTKRVLDEAYSEFRSTYRALSAPSTRSAVVADIAPAVASIQGAIMVMGSHLHRTMDEIREDMEHKTPSTEVAAEIATLGH